MEYLRGLNLHDLVARFGPQPESRVIHILAQVCDSLAEAHGLGLIHRDIKPGNIFLCNRGGVPDCVKVLDFGLVREYHADEPERSRRPGDYVIEGTPWFMPPEAIRGSAEIDPRSDLYSLGALGYFLLTGQYIFDAETVAEIHEKQLYRRADSADATHRQSHQPGNGADSYCAASKKIRRCARNPPANCAPACSPRRRRRNGRRSCGSPGGMPTPSNSPAARRNLRAATPMPTVSVDLDSRIE